MKRNKKPKVPASVSLGMHILESEKLRPVYYLLRSLVALAGIVGSLMTFMTAWENRSIFTFHKSAVMLAGMISWLWFSIVFMLRGAKPSLSRNLACGSVIVIMGYGLINLQVIAAGITNAADLFLRTLFLKYKDNLPYAPDTELPYTLEQCTNIAMGFVGVLIAMIICLGVVRKPNSLIFWCTAFSLPELCLYFGLVPDRFAFGLLITACCGVFAADVTEYGAFSDRSAENLFAKTASQNAFAAALLMLTAFCIALIGTRDFQRPEKMDNYRTAFIEYMKDFTWEKFLEDVSDSIFPSDKRTATHDGKLGNVDSLEFSGRNMLEVTLPYDAESLYLKGFTGVKYGGSRWSEGAPMPALETPLTSPELFSGRGLRYVDGMDSIRLKDVIVRNTGTANNLKYYPINAAGLLETDGLRRRYGVYFPSDTDWRKTVINNAETIVYPEDMQNDEQKLRTYAYTYCLDVPPTFTAAEEFFADYEGEELYDELLYIRKKLAADYEYTLDSGKKPFASDFAQWFLTENYKGSCTHFASAAVLLCRSRGIPARYCEGFIIKPEDIKSYTPENGYVTITVPDNRAHAWAEVYIDGYGWLSYEVTPGYGNVAYLPEDEEWDETSASEITHVTTEPPSFTEHITSPSVTTETGVSDTAVTTELTTLTTVESETADESGAPAQTEAHENAEDGETDTDITTVPPDYGNANSPASPDDAAPVSPPSGGNAEPSEAETTTPAPETTVSETLPNEELHKGLDPETLAAVFKVLKAIAVIGAIILAIVLRRVIILANRRKLAQKSPEKAAVQLYRMLMRLAKKHGADISVSADDLPAAMGSCEGFDKELCGTVIMTALKARFGEGVSSAEAEGAINAYNQTAQSVILSMPEKIISIVIFCSDKYV